MNLFILCTDFSVFDWMFAQVHTDVIGDDVRTVYLTGLQKVYI